MWDFLTSLDMSQVFLLLKIIAVVFVLMVIAAVVFVLKILFQPSLRLLQWLFAYTPGTRPNDVTAGLVHGLRLMMWSLIFGFITWYLAIGAIDMLSSWMNQQQERGAGYRYSVAGVIAVGAFLAISAIISFRTPAPPERGVERVSPEVRIVERRVPVKETATPRLQAPASVGRMTTEAPKAKLKSEVVPRAKLKTEPPIEPFRAVWKMRGRDLPTFEIDQAGAVLSGNYYPMNGSGAYPLQQGTAKENVAEFVVEDQFQRLHFRVTLLTAGDAKVEGWMTPEDAVRLLSSLKRIRVNGSKQKATAVPKIPDQEVERLTKPVTLGIFRRVAGLTSH